MLLVIAQIQVSGPRYPCTKIEKRWNMPGLTDRVAESGRTGWYCRVVREGRIEPGAPLMLVERPYPKWTIALINDFASFPQITIWRQQSASHVPPAKRVLATTGCQKCQE